MDETDEYVDVHKRYHKVATVNIWLILCMRVARKRIDLLLLCRIRVAAAAAASSVARAPSVRRITAHKGPVSEQNNLPIFNLLFSFVSMVT